MKLKSIFLFAALICCTIATFSVSAQDAITVKKKKHKTGSLYVSWGYNHEWYTKSDVYVKQGSLGNDYELVAVNGHDHKGWDKSIFKQPVTIPQYNYRVGYYFNDKQDLGIEINFDHTKFIIADSQSIHLKGKLNGVQTDKQILFAEGKGFYYFLNNGANFLLFNLVKRVGLYHTHDNFFRLDVTGKAGIGPVIPHVQNELFGLANDPHFQLGGWNVGAETAVRATFLRYGYAEFSQKVDYARYSHLSVADGLAHQAFGTYELILSVGFIIPTTHHNFMFESERPPLDGIGQ